MGWIIRALPVVPSCFVKTERLVVRLSNPPIERGESSGRSTPRNCIGMTIRILVVDDHPIVRQGLKTLLEGHSGWQVVGEASDGAEAIEKAKNLNPGARGYVVKSNAARDLLAAVEAVSQHRVFTALNERSFPQLT